MMFFLTKISALRAHKGWLYGLDTSAINFEVIELACMVQVPALAKHLTLIHLLLWALFIGVFIVRKVCSVMLHSLMNCHPAAVDPAKLPAGINPIAQPLKVFPAIVNASFEALTTHSNGVSRPGDQGSRSVPRRGPAGAAHPWEGAAAGAPDRGPPKVAHSFNPLLRSWSGSAPWPSSA